LRRHAGRRIFEHIHLAVDATTMPPFEMLEAKDDVLFCPAQSVVTKVQARLRARDARIGWRSLGGEAVQESENCA